MAHTYGLDYIDAWHMYGMVATHVLCGHDMLSCGIKPMCGMDDKWYAVIGDNTTQVLGNYVAMILMVVFGFVGCWHQMCMHGLVLSVSKLGRGIVS